MIIVRRSNGRIGDTVIRRLVGHFENIVGSDRRTRQLTSKMKSVAEAR